MFPFTCHNSRELITPASAKMDGGWMMMTSLSRPAGSWRKAVLMSFPAMHQKRPPGWHRCLQHSFRCGTVRHEVRSGEAHCDQYGRGGPARPTAIESWQLRSGEAHSNQELADEVRRGRGGGRKEEEEAGSPGRWEKQKNAKTNHHPKESKESQKRVGGLCICNGTGGLKKNPRGICKKIPGKLAPPKSSIFMGCSMK